MSSQPGTSERWQCAAFDAPTREPWRVMYGLISRTMIAATHAAEAEAAMV